MRFGGNQRVTVGEMEEETREIREMGKFKGYFGGFRHREGESWAGNKGNSDKGKRRGIDVFRRGIGGNNRPFLSNVLAERICIRHSN